MLFVQSGLVWHQSCGFNALYEFVPAFHEACSTLPRGDAWAGTAAPSPLPHWPCPSAGSPTSFPGATPALPDPAAGRLPTASPCTPSHPLGDSEARSSASGGPPNPTVLTALLYALSEGHPSPSVSVSPSPASDIGARFVDIPMANTRNEEQKRYITLRFIAMLQKAVRCCEPIGKRFIDAYSCNVSAFIECRRVKFPRVERPWRRMHRASELKNAS